MTTPDTTTTSKSKLTQQSPFDPLSTTPATNLVSPLPPDLDVDVLVIGGKDVRHILYTAYAEVGEHGQQKSDASNSNSPRQRSPGLRGSRRESRRKIDVTVSHEDKYVVARNVLVLSLVLGVDLDGAEAGGNGEGGVDMEVEKDAKEKAAKEKLARIWDIYYTRFLPDPETRDLLASQAEKLCQVSKTMEDWEQGPYGGTIHLVNQKSLDAVRGVWEQYAEAARSALDTEKVGELHSALVEGMRSSPDEQRQKWALGSSAAPLTVLLKDQIRFYVQVAWEFDQNIANAMMLFPNPTFAAGLLSEPDSESESESQSPGSHRRLAYPSNGVLGYHLALIKAPLTELSPLRIDRDGNDFNDGIDEDPNGHMTALRVAKHQFTQWSLAFRELAAAEQKRLTIRFAVDGWFPLCQSLLHPPAAAKSKIQFDIIDTTDLSSLWDPSAAGVPDPPGLLGLLVAAKRLLKDRASSTLVLDDREGLSLVVDNVNGDGNMDSNNSSSAQAEASIFANHTTGAFILGMAPVEYWSNASVKATVDECLLAASSLYDEDREQLQGLDKDKEAMAAAAAARVKKLEEQGLHISNRLFRKHSRWLAPGQQHGGKWRKSPVVNVDAKELAEAAWRVYEDSVIYQIEGQRVVHEGQELIKITWGKGLWQTFMDFIGVVGGQFETDREEFRRVIMEKIGGNVVQDALLQKALEEVVSESTTATEAEADGCPVFTASFDVTSGTLTTITGHLDFITEEDKKLLADKTVPISLRQSSPWTIDIVLGAGTLVKPLVFPTPVLKEGSKTRIARKSGYIEVIAPAILNPLAAKVLDEYIFPTVLQTADSSSETSQLVPTPLNAPTVNLDSLPILSISDTSRLSFLGPLASSMYSPRELRERQAAFEKGLPETSWDSARLNLKESLHTMINIAAGLQVGQSGLFALCPVSGSGSSSSSSDGRHILILVSAIRLDCSAQSGGGIVIDAAVLPLTHSLLAKKNNNKNTDNDDDDEDLQSFLVLLRTLDCVDLSVTDAELALWKSILPSFAERCRAWSHSPSSCEYATTGQVPLSLKKGDPVLCTCGTGHFPPNYLSLPLWESAAAPHATRVAISAPYCSPAVEKVVFDPVLAKKIAERGLEEALRKKEERCRSCGKGEEELVEERKAKGGETAGKTAEVLRKCARCLKVKYCSAECQRRDWKTHRTECVESEEHHR
ncbi:hypothetical protein NEUTE1DRAFT_123641 [Neurospora tetrasperma FGSC 2508]|uniref:MYND-type domain-containing protein n=1 Tax=Neurospora tetrasperma (strain FGSC 2508 / ATCC MYA-4615 / P0657) TaxID=510951 RepID=F8MSV2_NEUT8|nr:uncharacterized protein NEUTE1DRAFT_123641 [Neurospora tetrasperma FGSC 2508]EGO55135.1 hypothetical protein NEUTE1DRAFT_123641 [Neurospora tetrasperma FGSC 2508]